jgi:hypothetical protein
VIHYNVWFSFKNDALEAEGLRRVHAFLADLQQRDFIAGYTLLRNRASGDRTKLARFHALITFRDNEQFGRPFQEVSRIGIHAGLHGFMIEHVADFHVEVFEELDLSAS